MNKKIVKKLGIASLASVMSLSGIGDVVLVTKANTAANATQSGFNILGSVESYEIDGSKVELKISTGERIRITFLDNNMFRLYLAPQGKEFLEYPEPNSKDHTATITDKKDSVFETENKIQPKVEKNDKTTTISTDAIKLVINNEDCLMTLMKSNGDIVWQEAEPLMYNNKTTKQTLVNDPKEYFYGGGTQNGRFSHKGNVLQIATTNTWVDNSVASPNPFYWSTKGYGVVRNTWKPGEYDFGSTDDKVVTTTHNESRFDAYYFVDDGAESILNDYYELTGYPVELPEYASYLGHLNCYNRDYWLPVEEGTYGAVKLGDNWYKESQSDNGGELESLLGDAETTAQQIIEDHKANDMPIGWFLPNDGYGCGYGQTTSQAGDIDNLEAFGKYANENGIEIGLWTQSNLWPADPSNPQKGERDIYKEVSAGVHAVKTDVAWVGAGYSMALDGISVAYDAITKNSAVKPTIVTLNGWGGSQRYGGIWSGDQSGGQWEYIRFHIPTYIGTALSGQPNVGSDMDGIFGGNDPTVQTRDFQWKAFTTYMLDMDGWGSNQKSPWALGEDATSINRAYLKLKAQLMPYNNTISHNATAKGGLPMIRAMFLEEQNDFTLGTKTQYQYMWGDNFLVAPVYQNTAANADGDDIRNDIYLPSTTDIWVDYFTGEQYRGGQVLNNLDAPLWKLPLFVKNGSIIPMYAENNNPMDITETNEDGLDRSKRIVEFYPYGETSFEQYEDDGITMGGASATTNFTSKVDGTTAVLSANKTIGNYTGMVKERDTEFIVNVSEKPSAVTGTVKGEDVTFTEVGTQAEYDAAEGNVYFYNDAPSIFVKDFATEGTKYANTDETTQPKLYVKSTEKIDVTANDYSVTIEGFKNEQDLGLNEETKDLVAPTGLTSPSKTWSTVDLTWNEVEGADTYDVLVDGEVYRNIKTNTYQHHDLNYLTHHTYQVRAVNKKGYSAWSEEIKVQTADNPYRNVPENIDLTWDWGDAHGKLAGAIDHDKNTIFHSTNPVTPDQMLVMDLNKAYDLETITYQPRMDNKGNGTVKRMDVYASIDGVNYEKVWDGTAHDAWSYDTEDMDVEDIKTISFGGETIRARYLKFSVLESTGGFFSTSELTPYKKEGTKGALVGDTNNSGAIEDNDLTFFENYVGLLPVDNDWGYSNALGNFDKNDIIDAYDISLVARQVGNPVNNATAAKGVEGKIQLLPSKTDIKAGDLVTIQVYGIGLKNVNAFSVEMPVDKLQFEVKNFGSSTLASMFMRNFSKTRFHNDGSIDNYVAFANVGKQQLINGTGNLATITIKAVTDFNWDTTATRVIVVGQDLSSSNALIDNTVVPELPEVHKYIEDEDISSITFTDPEPAGDENADAKAAPAAEIDGSEEGESEEGKDKEEEVKDGSDIWQGEGWRTALFDRDPGTLAEFKYFIPANPDKGTEMIDVPENVKLPKNFNIDFEEVKDIKTFTVESRPSSNGALVTSKLAYIDEHDNVVELEVKEGDKVTYEINKKVKGFIFTPLTTLGKATGTQTGTEENRMLTLRDIVIEENADVPATGISFNEGLATHTYIGEIADISATVAPGNPSNPLYTIKSSDENIAKVIKIPTETGYIYGIEGVSTGTVTLTATSIDGEFTDTMEFTVKDGVNADRLVSEVTKAKALSKKLFTEESYNNVMKIVDDAETLMKNDPSQDDVDKITRRMVEEMLKLEYVGSDDTRPDSANLLSTDSMKVVSATNYSDTDVPENVLDGDKNTIWHTSYQSDASLPVEIIIDLGADINLEQIDYLARQSSHNGHITRYQVEVSSNGEDFNPVLQGTFANNEYELDDKADYKKIKFEPVEARYVKFIALETLGDTDNVYASVAELNFYGVPVSGEVVDKTALQELIKTAETKVEKDYTEESWKTFMTALDFAKGIEALEDASANDVKDATEKLQSALEGLVVVEDTTIARNQLKKAIDKVEAAKADPAYANLAQSVKDQIETRLTLAKGMYANTNATNAELLSAFQGLADIMHYLNFTGDKTVLKELIDACEALDLSLYQEAGQEEFKAALAEAKALYENADALDADIAAVTSKLKSAKDALKLIETTTINTSALQAAINSAKDAYNNPSNYVENDAWTAFAAAYENAFAVLNTPTSQEAVDQATNALISAYSKISLKNEDVDQGALKDFLTKAEAVDKNQYTKEDYEKIMDAVAKVKAFMEKDSFTASEYAEILQLIADTTKIIDENKVSGSENGTTGSDGGVNTGDESNSALFVGLIMLSGMALFAIKKKEDSEKA